MTRDIERLAAGEHVEIEQYSLRLGRLRDDPTFAALCDARLAGTTRSRWDVACAAVRSAGSRLDKWRETVARADRLLRASPPDAAEASRLLIGRTVQLTRAETPKEDRRPPASASSEPRFSLGYIKSLILDDIRTAERAVAEVAEVLEAARSRLDRLAAGLDEAEPLLDPMADDASRAELTALRRGLDELRELVEADPLALGRAGAAGQPGPARLPRLDALNAGLARLAGRLAPASARRAETAGRLAGLRVAAGKLAALESRARDRRASLAERITATDRPAAPAATVGLDARLAAAEMRFWPDWRAVGGELDEIDSEIETATREAERVIKRAGEISAEWELLDFRLKAYRGRADRIGLAGHSELRAVHGGAREVLDTAPCDLRRAADAVHAYMKLVNDLGQGNT